MRSGRTHIPSKPIHILLHLCNRVCSLLDGELLPITKALKVILVDFRVELLGEFVLLMLSGLVFVERAVDLVK